MKTTMSLARALKEKNRTAEKVENLRKHILHYNSVDLGTRRPISVPESVKQLETLEENLIRIKAAITAANAPVARELNELMMLRAVQMFYGGLNTSEFRTDNNYKQQDVEITTSTVIAKLAEIQKKIDNVQDKLDEYNALHKVEIDLLET